MRYRWRDMPDLIRTPIGRSQFIAGVFYRSWPFLSRAARIHRQTLGRRTRIVAVVGSFGKTTTARAIATVFGKRITPLLELNEWSFVAAAVLGIRPQDRNAVIEVGIGGPGEMERFAQMIRPDIAVVTSIGSDHHRSLGSLETTRREKAEMVHALPRSGFAILNGDDPNVTWMRDNCRAKVISYGLGAANDICATDIRLDWPRGTRLTLYAGGAKFDMCVRLLGKHMVYPILAAIGVAQAVGLDLEGIIPMLEQLPPAPGRMEPIRLKNGAWILRDENKSSIETIHSALEVLGEIPAKRRIVVMGEVTEVNRSQGPIYRAVGEHIARVASHAVFLCSHNHFQCYSAGAVRAGLAREALVYAHKNVLGAAEALELESGDVVLLKGRGSQRLDRIALKLSGRTVRCEIAFCNTMPVRCDKCAMLERGWGGLRVVL